MASGYDPHISGTSGIPLDPVLSTLVDRLAERIHDAWAAERIADGWRYGPTRDDACREHPCIVPYGDLPESEREYDRVTVRETLRGLLALGYRILPPE